ncbi:MAG: helix-turn-helix domain-containing protein [Aquiluna sp.]|nr:helix-turn-helix domain-containing protein [Aquiluna sp.]
MSERWTFLTHHAHVLLALNENPDCRIEELARKLGLTTRSTVNVLNDLTDGGYLSKEKFGRRNHYSINRDAELRHETSAHRTTGDLVDYLGGVAVSR